MASTPIHNPSSAVSVLYWLRRHGGQASDEQIKTFAVSNGQNAQLIINRLVRARAIRAVG